MDDGTAQLKPTDKSILSRNKYLKIWAVGLFIGCKTLLAAGKKGQEFYAGAARRNSSEETRVRAKPAAALGLLCRNYRENRLEYSAVFLHCIFALPESRASLSCLFLELKLCQWVELQRHLL